MLQFTYIQVLVVLVRQFKMNKKQFTPFDMKV